MPVPSRYTKCIQCRQARMFRSKENRHHAGSREPPPEVPPSKWHRRVGLCRPPPREMSARPSEVPGDSFRRFSIAISGGSSSSVPAPRYPLNESVFFRPGRVAQHESPSKERPNVGSSGRTGNARLKRVCLSKAPQFKLVSDAAGATAAVQKVTGFDLSNGRGRPSRLRSPESVSRLTQNVMGLRHPVRVCGEFSV